MYCIVYCCDNNFVGQTAASIYSLFENSSDCDDYDVYIMGDSFSQDNIKKLGNIAELFQRNISVIESKPIIDKIKSYNWKSSVDDGALSTYVRLFLAEELPEKYQKIVYIDSDTIVIRPINELTSYAENRPLACAIDITSQRYKRVIGFDEEDYYFNCGVMVYNRALWKQNKCQERIMNYAINNKTDLEYGDQDIINIVLRKEIEALPLKYDVFPFFSEVEYESLISFMDNAKYYSKEEFNNISNDSVIIHLVYSVFDRPWMKGNINPYSEIWKEYMDKSGFAISYKNRKWYSRTRVYQVIYKIFGAKAVLKLQKKRFNNSYDIAAARYKKDGVLFG